MKILFVINGLNRGGAERMLMRILGSSEFSKDELTVVSLLGPGDLSPEVLELGHKLIHLNATKSIFGVFRLFRLIGVIRSVRPDVVHSWLYQSDLVAGFCAFLLRFKPVIWSIRVQGISASSHNKLTTRLCLKSCALLSHHWPAAIVSNAHASRKTHVDLGYKESKIVVIPNGIDVNAFSPSSKARRAVRKAEGITDDEAVILLVCRFDKQKNLGGFFGVADEILASIPNAKFVLCGKGMDASNKELAGLVAKAQLGTSVHFLGTRDDVAAVLNAGDVLVSASNEEGWPNVIGEAMACGVPCVATDVGDTARIVADTGHLVKAGDMEALARQTICVLQRNASEKRNLSKSARRYVAEHFEISVIAKQFRELYASVTRDSEGLR